MKSKISIFALSFATVCMMSSCLGDKNDTEIVFYDDAAITVLTLGELKKPSHSGKENDSIKIVGSKYTLKIEYYLLYPLLIFRHIMYLFKNCPLTIQPMKALLYFIYLPN